jgi:hypothetical protein
MTIYRSSYAWQRRALSETAEPDKKPAFFLSFRHCGESLEIAQRVKSWSESLVERSQCFTHNAVGSHHSTP